MWYIDFADWSVISPCIEAIQMCVKFLSWTRGFTQYILIEFYGKSEYFAKTAGFRSAGHILQAIGIIAIKSKETMVVTYTYRYSSGHLIPIIHSVHL